MLHVGGIEVVIVIWGLEVVFNIASLDVEFYIMGLELCKYLDFEVLVHIGAMKVLYIWGPRGCGKYCELVCCVKFWGPGGCLYYYEFKCCITYWGLEVV